jgi:hypothetical protein
LPHAYKCVLQALNYVAAAELKPDWADWHVTWLKADALYGGCRRSEAVDVLY